MTVQLSSTARGSGIDLTEGSVWRHLIAFSLPMLAGSMIQVGYSVVNAIWVGRGLGADSMAVLTVSFPVFFLLMAVAGGLSMGASILVSQAFGAKDLDRVRMLVNNAMLLVCVVSILVIVIGQLVVESIFRLMQTPIEVLPMAVSYGRIFLCTVPFMFSILLLTALLRGVGDSKTPLYFQASALLLAAVLDPLLMFGVAGFPRLGLNGTAFAAIIAQSLALLAMGIWLGKSGHLVAPDWRHISFDAPSCLLMARIGIPTMLQQGLVSTGMVVLTGLVNSYGRNATAAFGAVGRIDMIAFMPAMSVGMAVSTIAGQNIGAMRFDRVREVFRCGLVFACGVTMLATIGSLFFPDLLLHLFTDDPVILAIGRGYLHVIGFGYLFFAAMFVSNGIINGAGHTIATTFFSLLGLWIVRLPLAGWLSHTYGRIEFIWYAMLFSLGLGLAASMLYYRSDRWMQPIKSKSN
ncbi:MAG: MATE family efflux transporter [Candidatus Riflebacteria bacterium]|nr:MATE family efflux transporter [Candidatus Riflebacteria bacterium]